MSDKKKSIGIRLAIRGGGALGAAAPHGRHDEMSELSDEAKAVAGVAFGLGDKCVLSFGMVESRPSAKTQAALDELLAAGLITRKQINQSGAVEYRATTDLSEYARWLRRNGKNPRIRFPLVEPIAPTPETKGGER